jgi:hypothetical protein
MIYLGDFQPGAALAFTFNTRKGDGTPITITGTPALAVRKNAGSSAMTLDAAPVVTKDLGGVVGLHGVTLTLSDSDFVTGEYDFVVTVGAVDGVSVVGSVVAHFSINRAVASVAQTGDAYAIVNNGTYGNAHLAKPGDAMVATGVTTGLVQRAEPDNTNIGLIKTAVDLVKAKTDTLTQLVQRSEPPALTNVALEATAQSILAAVNAVVADDGAIPWTVTVKDSDGVIDTAAEVWLTSTAAGTTILRSVKQTNDAGQVTFHLDSGVTYWIQVRGSDGTEATPVSHVGGA